MIIAATRWGRLRRVACAAIVTLGVAHSLTAVAQTASPRALHVVTASQSVAHASPKNRVVSPYARAAAAHARSGLPPAGRSPTRVQGMGKPHNVRATVGHK
jgi:hypothetical protein